MWGLEKTEKEEEEEKKIFMQSEQIKRIFFG